jgi:hypothetical protein
MKTSQKKRWKAPAPAGGKQIAIAAITISGVETSIQILRRPQRVGKRSTAQPRNPSVNTSQKRATMKMSPVATRPSPSGPA